jgi:DNA-binding response OmpR family regulator
MFTGVDSPGTAFAPEIGHLKHLWGVFMSDVLGRILIVDDEPDVLEVLTAYFSDGRFDVMTAQQGADAVMIANFHRPDAVLLDILMPGMDGVKVLRAIRAMDSTIPVVMVTANADEKVARDTLTMGAFDYVPKPFDFDVLDRIVVAAVAAGADRAWSPFGVHRSAPRARTLTAEQVAALVRNGTRNDAALTPMRRVAN